MIKTIKELENRMYLNNIKNTFTPNFSYVTDIGEGLENLSGLYVWYYVDERGNRTDIKYFNSEKDAV
jgi:hypothetical protein